MFWRRKIIYSDRVNTSPTCIHLHTYRNQQHNGLTDIFVWSDNHYNVKCLHLATAFNELNTLELELIWCSPEYWNLRTPTPDMNDCHVSVFLNCNISPCRLQQPRPPILVLTTVSITYLALGSSMGDSSCIQTWLQAMSYLNISFGGGEQNVKIPNYTKYYGPVCKETEPLHPYIIKKWICGWLN